MEQLRTWRNERGIKSEDAGKMVGVTGVQWTRYETGERSVSLFRLPLVSKVTGIPARDLRPDLFEAMEATQ